MGQVDLQRVGDSLSGAVGDRRVDLVLDVPNSRAGIRGTCLGAVVDGHWHIESNYENPAPVGLFLGDVDGAPVHLRNVVHLSPHPALQHAELAGTIGDRDLRVRVTPVDASAGPVTLEVDGEFDGARISVYVVWPGSRSGIHIEGLVGGNPVTLDVTRSSVRGEYEGPDALFLLFACAPLYFL